MSLKLEGECRGIESKVGCRRVSGRTLFICLASKYFLPSRLDDRPRLCARKHHRPPLLLHTMTSTIPISKSEKSYIQTALQSNPPLRADGRSLLHFRTVLLETGFAPLSNGSARVNIGKNAEEGGGGTEVLAATKLEVEDVGSGDGVDGGRVVVTVSCSPAAYPHLNTNALDDLQYDYTITMHQTLSHPSLLPTNLGIIPQRKSWLLSLDIVVLSDAGNIYDAMFMAARAAFWDTKVPITRAVQYSAKNSRVNAANPADQDDRMEMDDGRNSGFDVRKVQTATDFELPDYWDEGEPLGGRELWPVCVTLNIHGSSYFLDATLQEEASVPVKLLLASSFPSSSRESSIQCMRLLGPADLQLTQIESFITEGEKHARILHSSLEAKLRDEDLRRNQKARDRFSSRS